MSTASPDPRRRIFSATIALGSLSAFLYLLGDAFHAGFWETLGLGKTGIAESTERTLLSGFDAIVFLIRNSWGVLLIILGCAGAFAFFLFSLWHFRVSGPRVLGWLSRFFFHQTDEEAGASRKRHPILVGIGDALLFGTLLFAVGVSSLGAWVAARYGGQGLAEDVLGGMNAGVAVASRGMFGSWSRSRITVQSSEGTTDEFTGFLLGVKADFAVLYRDRKVELVPTSRIVRIQVDQSSGGNAKGR